MINSRQRPYFNVKNVKIGKKGDGGIFPKFFSDLCRWILNPIDKIINGLAGDFIGNQTRPNQPDRCIVGDGAETIEFHADLVGLDFTYYLDKVLTADTLAATTWTIPTGDVYDITFENGTRFLCDEAQGTVLLDKNSNAYPSVLSDAAVRDETIYPSDKQNEQDKVGYNTFVYLNGVDEYGFFDSAITLDKTKEYEITFQAQRKVNGAVHTILGGDENFYKFIQFFSSDVLIYETNTNNDNILSNVVVTANTFDTWNISLSGWDGSKQYGVITKNGIDVTSSNNDVTDSFTFLYFGRDLSINFFNGAIGRIKIVENGVTILDISSYQLIDGVIYGIDASASGNNITMTGGSIGYIPAKNASQDIFDNDLVYSGSVKYNADVVKMPCGEYDGTSFLNIGTAINIGKVFELQAYLHFEDFTALNTIFGHDSDYEIRCLDTKWYYRINGNTNTFPSSTQPLNTWLLFRFVRNGTDVKIYFGSTLKTSLTLAVGDNIDHLLTDFGKRSLNDTYFVGKAHSIKIIINGVDTYQYPDGLTGYDVSGNDNHGAPTNVTRGDSDNQLYHLTKGYTRLRSTTDAITNVDKLIPYQLDGTPITDAEIAALYSGYARYSEHPAKVVGNVYGNNEVGSIDFNPDSAITGFKPSRILCKSDTDYFEAEILDFPDYTTDYVWTSSTLFNTLMCLGSTTVRYSFYIAMTTATGVADLQKNFYNLGVYLTQKTAAQMLSIASSGGWRAEWEMFSKIHFNSQFVSVIDTLLIDPFLDVSYNISKAMDWSSLRDHPVQSTSTLRPLFNYNATARNMGFAGVDEYLAITSKSLDADFRVLIKKVSGTSYLMGSDANNYISHNSTSLDVKINGTLIDFIPLRTGITGVNCLIEIKRISGSVTAQAIKSDGTVISGGLPTVNSDTLTIDTIGGYNSANVAASEIEDYAIEKATAGNLTAISDEILKQFAKI